MLEELTRISIVAVAGVLWLAVLRLLLNSDLSRARKVGWSALLAVVGIGVGIVLPLDQLWDKFRVLIVVLPLLGLADVLLFRTGRGLSFWVRACGFEICTVFGVAAGTRLLLNLVGAAPVIGAVR